MAWTEPRTWISGELVTASLFNQQLKSNLEAIVDSDGAYVNAVTGPHATGGSTNAYTRQKLGGAFTSDGSSSRVTGLLVDGALTCASGDDKTEGGYFTTSVTTPASETVARVTQLHVAEPDITVGSGGTITAAASLYVSSAPSEGTSNYAVWVDEGNVLVDDDLIAGQVIGGTSPSVTDGVFLGKSTSNHLLTLESARDDDNGCTLNLRQDSASPANNDEIARIHGYGKDSGGTYRNTHRVDLRFDDVTATSMDSSMRFSVMSNVNGGGTDTVATLTSAGVWTDASDEDAKEYLGTLQEHLGGSVLDQLADLNTGVYTQKDLPPGKTGETHAGPTAQQWFELFSLGRDPALFEPGIGAKDLASVALAAVQELVERNAALETRIADLEAATFTP